jgi:hypothetical protein
LNPRLNPRFDQNLEPPPLCGIVASITFVKKCESIS